MYLTINALACDIDVADTNPALGQVTIHVAKGTSASFDVTLDQLSRLAPQFNDLETRVDATSKGPIMTWSVAASANDDLRSGPQAGNAGTLVKSMHPGVLSVGSGNATVQINGANLMANQVKATKTLGAVAAGAVLYTAVVPGSLANSITVRHVVAGLSTALSVSVTGTAITVNLATDGAGVAISTGAQVIAAVAALAAAKALVVGTVPVAGTAQAAAVANLVGGEGPGITVSVNGVTKTLTSTSATALVFPVAAADLTGLVATDVTRVEVVMGLQTASLTVAIGA